MSMGTLEAENSQECLTMAFGVQSLQTPAQAQCYVLSRQDVQHPSVLHHITNALPPRVQVAAAYSAAKM